MRIAGRRLHLAARTAGSAPAALNHHHPTMPPGFTASIGDLDTFILPERVSGSVGNEIMAKAMISTWRRDGILQVAMSKTQRLVYDTANASSGAFFRRSHVMKQRLVDSKSYAGYIGSGEELTNGIADYAEIFTVTKDLATSDLRVAADWPCHGPCPWPDRAMKNAMTRYMDDLGRSGETLLQLIEIGLGVPQGSLTKYTRDGWHHMRVLRFPPMNNTNGKGKKGRGIGSHTDYGLLVMATQDHVGGLFVRPPQKSDIHANWERSAAGLGDEGAGWVYIPPSPGVFTVFPGDMMQYMTNNVLQSTPHKVGLNTRERFAFAYFHEPNFRTVIKPLPGYNGGQSPREGVHYGTHFTNMCLRNYPDRITTKTLLERNGYDMLNRPELRQELD